MTATADGTARPAVPDIVEEHLEELAFLSIRKRKLYFSPEITARQVARQEARVAAHRDGLRVNSEAAKTLAKSVLDEGEDPWMVYAAASIWLELIAPDAAELAARWKNLAPEKLPSWREALREHDLKRVARIEEMLAPGRPAHERHLIVDAMGWQATLTLQQATAAANDDESLVRWSCARHLGHSLPREPGAAQLLAHLVNDPDVAVRSAALWSAALIDGGWAVTQAGSVATTNPVALRILGLFGTDASVAVIASGCTDEDRRQAAIDALIDHGGVSAVQVLGGIAAEDPGAAEAITGVLGSPPAPDDAVPIDAARAKERFVALAGDEGARLRFGLRRPWTSDADAQPMEWHWRAAIANHAGVAAMRRTVPDGLLAGIVRDDSVPGE